MNGYSIVRQGVPVATLVLPKCTALDAITCTRYHHPPKKCLSDWLAVRELDYLEKGRLRDLWRAMKGLMQNGDELRRFNKYHGPLAARSGYCLVRDGKIIATMVTVIA